MLVWLKLIDLYSTYITSFKKNVSSIVVITAQWYEYIVLIALIRVKIVLK